MNFTRREAVVGAASLAAMLPACARSGGIAAVPAGAKPLTIAGALPVVELAPMHLVVHQKYPGTTIRMGGVASLVLPENPVDIAGNAETQILRNFPKRRDLRIVMTLVEGNYAIIARRSAGINSLADLRGKKIGTFMASSAQYFISKMLKHAGLTDADANIMNIPSLQDMSGALRRGDLDAVGIWEPFSENALHDLGSDAIEFSGKGIYREHYNVNTTAGALADPVKRLQIVHFLRDLIEATADMKRNPTLAQQLVAKSGGFTMKELVRCWDRHTWLAGYADDMLDVLVEEEAWLAPIEKRATLSRADLAPIIDRSAYQEALALRR